MYILYLYTLEILQLLLIVEPCRRREQDWRGDVPTAKHRPVTRAHQLRRKHLGIHIGDSIDL